MKKKNDLVFAFYCFLSDAHSGKETFEDFCGEFGYDTDSRKAENTYNACKKALVQVKNIINTNALCDTLNELQEKHNC